MAGEGVVLTDEELVVEVVDHAEVCGSRRDAQKTPHEWIKGAVLRRGRSVREGILSGWGRREARKR